LLPLLYVIHTCMASPVISGMCPSPTVGLPSVYRMI
jgi:hypothetical protein